MQIGAIFSKSPSSWNNYRIQKILHSTNKLTLEQFFTRIKIEYETRARDVLILASSYIVNLVNKKNTNKENKNLKENKKSFKKKKNDITCFHCEKKGHIIRECKFKKAIININNHKKIKIFRL